MGRGSFLPIQKQNLTLEEEHSKMAKEKYDRSKPHVNIGKLLDTLDYDGKQLWLVSDDHYSFIKRFGSSICLRPNRWCSWKNANVGITISTAHAEYEWKLTLCHHYVPSRGLPRTRRGLR